MGDSDAQEMAEEILAALENVGETESWVERRLGASSERLVWQETFRVVTRRLLGVQPPRAADWEHLLVAAAARSTQPRGQLASDACKAAIGELCRLVDEDQFSTSTPARITTLASALTLALTAQRNLRQSIEAAIGALHDKFPHLLAEMAQQCQDIWQRRGQISGADGLFLWDTRNGTWRLNQDFKPLRPS
jgi:hypothetical protein